MKSLSLLPLKEIHRKSSDYFLTFCYKQLSSSCNFIQSILITEYLTIRIIDMC